MTIAISSRLLSWPTESGRRMPNIFNTMFGIFYQQLDDRTNNKHSKKKYTHLKHPIPVDYVPPFCCKVNYGVRIMKRISVYCCRYIAVLLQCSCCTRRNCLYTNYHPMYSDKSYPQPEQHFDYRPIRYNSDRQLE